MSQDNLASNRNSVGPENMIVYALGVVAFLAGLSLVGYSKTTISLVTGATSTTAPYLGIGIVVLVLGLAAIVTARLLAKRQLRQ
jgi:hypothetical protein